MPKRTNTQVISLLDRVPIFSACSKKELGLIARLVKQVQFPEGRIITRTGETGVGLHVISEGQAAVLSGDRELAQLAEGDFFGEIALLDGGPRSADVVAKTEVRTLALSAWDFRSLLEDNPRSPSRCWRSCAPA